MDRPTLLPTRWPTARSTPQSDATSCKPAQRSSGSCLLPLWALWPLTSCQFVARVQLSEGEVSVEVGHPCPKSREQPDGEQSFCLVHFDCAPVVPQTNRLTYRLGLGAWCRHLDNGGKRRSKALHSGSTLTNIHNEPWTLVRCKSRPGVHVTLWWYSAIAFWK